MVATTTSTQSLEAVYRAVKSGRYPSVRPGAGQALRIPRSCLFNALLDNQQEKK
jgi:hypothetical protein